MMKADVEENKTSLSAFFIYHILTSNLEQYRTWKILANNVPNTTAHEWDLPTEDWKELEIRIGYSADGNYCELRVVKIETLNNVTQFRRTGYYYDGDNNMYIGVGFTKTKIGVSDFLYKKQGTTITNYSTTIYYR